MPLPSFQFSKPGIFITGTDTGVGKTVIACAIASLLGDSGRRVGIAKPFASGCDPCEGDLVCQDTLLLKHHARCDAPLAVISPARYRQPLAPAPAADGPAPWHDIADALQRLDRDHDCLIIEGVGGLLVPLDRDHPSLTVLDLAAAIGYPVLVVTRPNLGTLNHTAMTVRLLRHAQCKIAGIVINSAQADPEDDPSIASNHRWLEKMNQTPVLATIPHNAEVGSRNDEVKIEDPPVFTSSFLLPTSAFPSIESARRALQPVHWPDVLAPASSSGTDATGSL